MAENVHLNPRDFYLCLPQRVLLLKPFSNQSGFSALYNASSLQLEKLEEKHKTDCSISISVAQCFSPHSPDLAGIWDLLALSLPRWSTMAGRSSVPRAFPQRDKKCYYNIRDTPSSPGLGTSSLCCALLRLSHRSKFLTNSLHGLTKLTARHTGQGMQHLLGQEPGPGSSTDHTSPLTPAPNISPATRTDFSFLLKIIFLGWDTVASHVPAPFPALKSPHFGFHRHANMQPKGYCSLRNHQFPVSMN